MSQGRRLSVLPKFTYADSRDEIPYSFHVSKIFVMNLLCVSSGLLWPQGEFKVDCAQGNRSLVEVCGKPGNLWFMRPARVPQSVSSTATLCSLTTNLPRSLFAVLAWLWHVQNPNLHNEVAS